MSDVDRTGLMDQARQARVEATRARRLARQISDHYTQTTFLRYADTLEAKAVALEQQASHITQPVIQTHQQMQQAAGMEQEAPSIVPRSARTHALPQQMQQAQVTPPAEDGDPDQSINSS